MADDSSAFSSLKTGSRGFKVKSGLWEYFQSDMRTNDENKQEIWTYCKHCDYKNKGKNHSTLENYLRRRHAQLFKQFDDARVEQNRIEKEKEIKKKSTTTSLAVFGFDVGSAKPYDRKSPLFQEMKHKLTMLAGCTSFKLSLFESKEFQELIAVVDRKAAASLPTRNTLKNWVLEADKSIRGNIKEILSKQRAVCFTADIWSQRGLTYSYLGVTVHFYDFERKKMRNAALACRHFRHPHTAVSIYHSLMEILEEWGIPEHRVIRYITDAGANIVCALKEQVVFQTEINPRPPPVAVPPCADWNLEEEEEEDGQEDRENTEEYFEVEEMLERVFPRRISCYAHKINNACKTVLDSDGSAMKAVKDEVLKVIQKFGHSGPANQDLKQICGKKLVKASNTRWHSFYFVVKRLLEVRDAFTQVCSDNKRDIPISFRWTDVETYCDLLKPIAEQSTYVEGQEYSTASLVVVPALLLLKDHLREFDREKEVCDQLTKEIDRRFQNSLDFDAVDFDPTFLICAMLDPEKTTELDSVFFEAGKKELKKFLEAAHKESDDVEISTVEPEIVEETRRESASMPLKKKRREFVKDPSSEAARNSISEEVSVYLSLLDKGEFPDGIDPLVFWENNKEKFPKIFPLALQFLSIPGTSAPSERLFSQAGLSSQGQVHNITPTLVESEVMLKYNKTEWI